MSLVLSACAPRTPPVRLTIGYPGQLGLYRRLADLYSATHPDWPAALYSLGASVEDAPDRLVKDALIAGTPDVAFVSPFNLALLADRDLIHPLAGVDLGALGCDRAVAQIGQVDGRQFAAPFGIAAPVVFINADLIDLAALGPTPDWPALFAAAQRIERAQRDARGLYISYRDHTGVWLLIAAIEAQGGRFLTDDGQHIAFINDYGRAALRLFREAARLGPFDQTLEQARQLFAAGKLAIFASSSSFFKGMQKASGGAFKMDVVGWPVAPAGRLPAGGQALVSLRERLTPEARGFITTALGQEGQMLVGTQAGYIPSNRAAHDTAQPLGQFFAEDPGLEAILRQTRHLGPWPALPGDEGRRGSDLLTRRLDAVVRRHLSIDEGLSAMVSDLQAIGIT